MLMRRTGALLAAVVTALGVAACDHADTYVSVAEKIRETGQVSIGTKWDQPNLSLKQGHGDPEGFDVDVAKYLVKELAGGRDVKITWRESRQASREAMLQNGAVDMIVASYSITAARKNYVTFGGPYVIAHQDTMVRADASDLTKATDLKHRRICQVPGSNSYQRIVEPPPDGQLGLPAELVGANTYAECVYKLGTGDLDAVTTDDMMLAGLSSHNPDQYKLLKDPFTDERYGVGLKKGDKATCEAVNRAVAKMWRDGTAVKLLRKWFGQTGLTLPTTPPPAERCS
ncbi:glutamate ABC transporter substrate-binding protein [Nonomuraea turkmeniaca]|uniref:Glutamate ABC transporter substrate-binding protein n=1 Tax=Nonomuraea turkmeniaca TaxID=103838 RepID=A0A5S4FY14_9ACTN|nr:glutamate ABC transporter substrate-binding protein [Nonomuraea turkmeniaca]TMR25001.1 glutamate ABC transporter substrate-binding protein [Nonomuraea turkmeniaca]